MTTLHALLIGADFYFPNRLPNGSTYLSLYGAVNDTHRIEKMLRSRVGTQLDIVTLRATNVPDRKEPPEPATQWPTYANITQAFRDLVARAQSGDQVLIHYSGHGGRVPTDERFKELKGANGVDETLVPIDIGDKSTRYVRDLDIAYFLQELVVKGAIVTVILDSCHSAGATRSALSRTKDSAPRSATGGKGGDIIDTTERPAEGVASADELVSAWKQLATKSSTTRAARIGPSFLPDAKGYVLLAACAAHESALENGMGPTRGGVLTKALIEALTTLSPRDTWSLLYERINASIKSRYSQTPQLLGDVNRKVFGTEMMSVLATMTVTKIDKDKNLIQVNGGLVTGLSTGASLGIYPPGATDFEPRKRKAVATVTKAEDTSSWAEAKDGIEHIELGGRVIVTHVGSGQLCRILLDDDTAPAFATLRNEITKQASGFLALVGEDDSFDYRISIDKGNFLVTSAAGEPVEHFGATLSASDRQSVSILVARLLHLAEYHRKLAITSPSSDFADLIDIGASLLPAGYDPESPRIPQGEPLRAEGENAVKAGSYVRLTVNNRSSATVYVGIFDFQDDWSITKLIPAPEKTGRYVEVDARKADGWSIEMYVPDNRTETRDVFKVFVTATPPMFEDFPMTPITDPKRVLMTRAGRPVERSDAQRVVRQFAFRVSKSKA